MVVHICCSVDSHYFLTKLKELYPNKKLHGFFYNPNIHPKEEYDLRLLDVKKSCKKLNIPLSEGEYELKKWLNVTKKEENEPEKGERCLTCFKERVAKTAKFAKDLGDHEITTTLLMSPKKSLKQLEMAAKEVEELFGVEFFQIDLRKNGGTNEQFSLSKKEGLYHQDYCGCIYALRRQKDKKNELPIELFSQINDQITPNSAKEKYELYEKDESKTREIFLNYRLLSAKLFTKDEVISSHPLFYSYPLKPRIKTEPLKVNEEVAKDKNGQIIFITIKMINRVLNRDFSNVKELLKNPLRVEEELTIRDILQNSFYSLTPIVVVDRLPSGRLFFECEAKIFPDVRELLAIVR